MYITPDAETAYHAQEIQFLDEEHTATQPTPSVIPAAEVPATAIAIPLSETELPKVTDEDNWSHLSDSEREGNPEESLLTPDAQVNGAMSSKTLEAYQMGIDSKQNTGAPALRKSRRKLKKVHSQPFQQKKKQK